MDREGQKMRLCIDAQGVLGVNRDRGIGRFGRALIGALIEIGGGELSVELLSNSHLGVLKTDCKKRYFVTPSHRGYRDGDRYLYKAAVEIAREIGAGCDLFLSISLFEGFVDECACALSGGLKCAVLYDLIPLVMGDLYLVDERVRGWYFERIEELKRADLLLAISKSSMEDAIRLLGISRERVAYIGCDVDPEFGRLEFCEGEKREILGRYGIDRGYIMYTGGADRRKNIEGLIEAYALLDSGIRSRYRVVVACGMGEDERARVREVGREVGVGDEELILTGYVEDRELAALYGMCSLFVFASLYEGFGMPIVEAMRCGAPVVGSDSSSIREIIEIKEALFDPQNHKEMAEVIRRGLEDVEFRERLIKNSAIQSQKYSIKESAKRCLAAMRGAFEKKEAEAKRGGQSGKKRERLAYISPIPPAATGVADYSAELIGALVEHYDITVVVEQERIDRDALPESVEVIDAKRFLEIGDSFDKRVYHFGNSHFHTYMVGLIGEYPGVVVSHDFFLSGMYGWMEREEKRRGVYQRALFYSHGYSGMWRCKTNPKGCGWEYPINKEIVDMAVGVITHSEYQRRLADRFYGGEYAKEWEVVRHLREARDIGDKRAARGRLGVDEEEFLICSFGFMGETKLNLELVEAFCSSELFGKKCRLVFVGARCNGEYQELVDLKIEGYGAKESIYITGFVDKDGYNDYLDAMDVGVQLRCKSRGETSGTVLDVMGSGKALIVNANGSMDDYPESVCIKLKDSFEIAELRGALERVYNDQELRERLGRGAREYIKGYHDPKAIGARYKEAIDRLYKNSPIELGYRVANRVGQIAKEFDASKRQMMECAKAITKNLRPKGKKRLFVDISELVKKDVKTGIQRVVRAISSELIKNEPLGYRVEPVYFCGGEYLYAREFTTRMLGVAHITDMDCEIEYGEGDIFLGLDLALKESVDGRDRLSKMREAGVSITFVVYDILPILHSEWWPNGAYELFKGWLDSVISVSDMLVCISEATMRSVEGYIQRSKVTRSLKLGYFHLGADIENSVKSSGITQKQQRFLDLFDFESSFLSVGTIEPRKGHSELLDAFEILWQKGINAKIVIVGKQGWMVERLIDRIRGHRELDRRLFWFEEASDEFLEIVYTKCSAVIASSFAEGFGLPIVEAAMYGKPVIARDIEVFREIGGGAAIYFDGGAKGLADAIESWLGGARSGEKIKYLSWQESAQQLKRVLGI